MQLIGRVLRAAMFGLVAAVATACGVAPEGEAGAEAERANEDTVTEISQALTSVTNSCVCVAAACGNGAIGGNNGTVHTGLSTSNVISLYRPDHTGTSASGWACRPEGSNRCVCIGINQGGSCGNGAIGGNHGTVHAGLSTATVIASYGPDRTGSVRTGWKCRISAF